MSSRRLAIGVLTAGLPAAACGRLETEVGAEIPPAAIPEASAPQMDAGAADAQGARDAGDAGEASACLQDLSNIGMADFHVSLSVATTESGWVALANQRSLCGPSVFWDIRVDDGGLVVVETDDVTNYGAVWSPGPRVNDGRPHDVLAVRKARVLSVIVDDAGSTTFPSWASFGKLPPVAVGTDVCVPQDGTQALNGTIANLCVASP
jgi:hypothetical protein